MKNKPPDFIILPETSPKPAAVRDWEALEVAHNIKALMYDHPAVIYVEPPWVGKVLRGEDSDAN